MQNERTRLFVVDDDASITAVLERLADSGFVMCGFARTPSEAINKLRATCTDLVLVEIALESSSELPLIQTIRNELPDLPVVAFSRLPESVNAERALRAGALGYVSKKASLADLVRVLRSAKKGQACFSSQMTRRLMTDMVRNRQVGALRKLTDREASVFRLLSDGHDLDSMARELGLNRKTVEIYRRRIKEKLEMDSVAQLIDYARNKRRGDHAIRASIHMGTADARSSW